MNTEYNFIGAVQPDIEELVRIFNREKRPFRLHNFEIFLDAEIKEAVSARFQLHPLEGSSELETELENEILLHRVLGYDLFRVPVIRKHTFSVVENRTQDERSWMEEHTGPVQTWEDFENFPWPDVRALDFRKLDWMEKNCPSGMGCFDLTGHIFEIVSFLFGYESLCMKLHDDPALVEAMFEKVGEFYVAYTKILADYRCVPAMWAADDFGFKSGTLISPETLKQYVFPWHKKCADAAHNAGKPYLLHSCGNLKEIMGTLIDEVGIDGKHSFEDGIEPVTDAVRKYGDKISIIGGMDVDFLCRADEAAIRKKVRDILDACAGVPGYCFGTGNSVPNYVPLDNYLTMMDEAFLYSRSLLE